MKMAVLMDPVHTLKAYKDSTVAMIKSAQEMGWSCFYFTVSDLFCRKGKAFALISSIVIEDENIENWAKVTAIGEYPLSDFQIILMRKDPPFNMEYIAATYALDLAQKAGVLIANNPQSLRDANEKFFTLQFSQCCPETLVTKNKSLLKAFWKEHQNVIFKPLEGMGGNSIFHVDEKGINLSVILEVLTKHETITIMAQRYIPEIRVSGDKRILIINGEPVPFALARIPAPGELRGNLAAGARGEVVPITKKEKWICEQLAPVLREKGLYFVGIDVIGEYLTEINVTSPTCIKEISVATGLDIAGDFLRSLVKVYEKR
jgi:glutathione synthase